AGDHHPLPMYLKFGVPVALATDDAGGSRDDITQEFTRAAETYHLKYQDLKKFARASLEHSFLPRESLWSGKKDLKIRQCIRDKVAPGSKISSACKAFLAASEKAQAQWK